MMKSFELRFEPEVVERLRKASLTAAYQRGQECSWAQLVREGAELILKQYEYKQQTQTSQMEATW